MTGTKGRIEIFAGCDPRSTEAALDLNVSVRVS
jgi:hypothetical protein